MWFLNKNHYYFTLIKTLLKLTFNILLTNSIFIESWCFRIISILLVNFDIWIDAHGLSSLYASSKNNFCKIINSFDLTLSTNSLFSQSLKQSTKSLEFPIGCVAILCISLKLLIRSLELFSLTFSFLTKNLIKER